MIRRLIAQGALSLVPGAMPRLATKSASGLFATLPLREWGIQPLRVVGGSYAVSPGAIARNFEEAGTPLPPSTQAALAAWIAAERIDR